MNYRFYQFYKRMEGRVKYLLISFILGLTDDHEDQQVVQLIRSHPEYLSTLISLEKELSKKMSHAGMGSKGTSFLRKKFNKLGLQLQ